MICESFEVVKNALQILFEISPRRRWRQRVGRPGRGLTARVGRDREVYQTIQKTYRVKGELK